jgi:RNA polymerase sigma-70 factor (ECF subfamily)
MMGGALFPFAASADAVPPLSAGVDGRNAAVDPARALAACDTAMARYAAGDEAAFAVVYDELAPRLYGYLIRQTRDGARSEDLVQQTFLQIHRARATFLPGAEVLPWAFAIARRLMIDGFRRGRREVLEETEARDDRPATEPAADDLVQAQELATRIRRELARLPETQRVAFELVKEEGLSLAEAAQVLGTTVAAVKLRAHRAYEALRAVLGDVLTKGGT